MNNMFPNSYLDREDIVNELSAQIRKQVLSHIEDMSNETFADKLGLDGFVIGATLLRERSSWPLEVAVKAATALGLHVSVEVSK